MSDSTDSTHGNLGSGERVISAILHVKPGRAVREEALDLRVGELALVLPLLLLLLGLSVWPALVSESAFVASIGWSPFPGGTP